MHILEDYKPEFVLKTPSQVYSRQCYTVSKKGYFQKLSGLFFFQKKLSKPKLSYTKTRHEKVSLSPMGYFTKVELKGQQKDYEDPTI